MSERGIARVYVSSTFRDLQRERGVVLEAIERAGAKPASMEYYGADDRRALDVCVADVRDSDLYIGIVGWRQGYCPAETPGIGITESEYLAAGQKSIPRLVYLTPELAEWQGERDADPSAISAFRSRLKEEVTAYPFASLEKLALAVGGDLAQRLPRRSAPAVPSDSLLPYLCDRVPQSNQVLDLLGTQEGAPPVCLARGDRDQSLPRFIDCLRELRLGEWLRSKYPTKECRLDWPSDPPAKVAARLRKGLALALDLDPRTASDDSLAARIAAQPGPVLVSAQLPAEAWSDEQQARVKSFVDYWRAFPRHAPPKPDLVVLWVEYPLAQRGALGVLGIASKSERRYAETVRGVASLEGMLELLPPADSVLESDATAWARLDAVRRAAPGRELDDEVGRIFAGRERIPMKELGQSLLRLLQQSGESNGGRRGGGPNPEE